MREASRRWKDSACKMARREGCWRCESEREWKGRRPRSKRGPGKENEWEKETSLPHGGRRGPYTERQWYDERIGGRPWDVETAGGERKRKKELRCKRVKRERRKGNGKENRGKNEENKRSENAGKTKMGDRMFLDAKWRRREERNASVGPL